MASLLVGFNAYDTIDGWSIKNEYCSPNNIFGESDTLLIRRGDTWQILIGDLLFRGKAEDLGITPVEFSGLSLKQIKEAVLDFLHTPKDFKVIYRGIRANFEYYPAFKLGYRAISKKKGISLVYKGKPIQRRTGKNPRPPHNIVFKYSSRHDWMNLHTEIETLLKDEKLFEQYCKDGCLFVLHNSYIGLNFILLRNWRGAFAIERNFATKSNKLKIHRIEELSPLMIGIGDKVYKASDIRFGTKYIGIDLLFSDIDHYWSEAPLVIQEDF